MTQNVTPTTQLLILSFILVFSCNHHFEGGYQTANAQATGGDVNVLYAGSLISIMETKIGPVSAIWDMTTEVRDMAQFRMPI